EPRHLERLIGAYITHEREAGVDRLVSEFIAEFDGLTGSGKRTKVLTDANLKRARLSGVVKDGRLDGEGIAELVAAMRRHSRPGNPKRLGLIGEEHLRQRLQAMGAGPRDRASKKGGPPAVRTRRGLRCAPSSQGSYSCSAPRGGGTAGQAGQSRPG